MPFNVQRIIDLGYATTLHDGNIAWRHLASLADIECLLAA